MVFGALSGRFGGPAFVVIGLALFVIALQNGLATRSFVLVAMRAEGTVTKLNAGGSHPQIRFSTEKNVEISYPQGGLIFGFRLGDKVEVLYNVANPLKTATVNTAGALWYPALILSGLGAVFLVVGALVWLRSEWPGVK